ncbi:MAG: hypothetical protein G01um101448_1156 [Parcubacteria group bacterium Gr01-1014_48]|nr:MAG: hypothetical protein G01um101448_1156 [Parcubacteria group bacterium Gr01-1014_48]TSC98918.1 MAG: hypothetical protein Greene101415_1216 [Parcubacteria group bacterium Greene1014_15]TSD07740.1 MAG: hypothetical protein Greene07144_772 [Parcubacteria group bacterium Greene0714_4]
MSEQTQTESIIILKGLEENDVTVLNSVQLFMRPYMGALVVLLWCMWGLLFFRFLYSYALLVPRFYIARRYKKSMYKLVSLARSYKHRLMEGATIFLVLCFLAMIGLYFSRVAIAQILWGRYRLAEEALWLAPGNVELAMGVGNYYFNGFEHDLTLAKKGYEQAVRIDPMIFLGHYQLARIYFVEGRFREALDEINKELEAYPNNLRSLYVRGLIEGYRGDLKAADDDFKKFISWAPIEWGGYNDRAWILGKLKKYVEMKVVAETGIQRAAGGASNPWLLNMLGVAELNLKKYAAAGTAFVEAKKLAEALTDTQWHWAYSGNSPSVSEEGRVAFIRAINDNLIKAKGSVDNTF